MFHKTRRAYTLIEIIVGFLLSILVMYVVEQMYVHSRNQAERPMATSAMENDLMSLSRWLQHDIGETDVQTIRSFPNSQFPNEPPGMSMESPRTLSTDQLATGTMGVVLWQKFVFYTLQPRPGNGTFGELVRAELTTSQGQTSPYDSTYKMPMGASVLPSAAASSSTRRTVASNLMLPNQTISHANFATVTTNQYGGFEVFWLKNPNNLGAHTYYDDNPQNRGEPVYIDIVLHDVSPRTGKDTIMRLPLRIKPNN